MRGFDLGGFGHFLFLTTVYLPLLLGLVGIIFLVLGFYFKYRKKNGNKYFVISIIILPIAFFLFLIPGLLVEFLVPQQ